MDLRYNKEFDQFERVEAFTKEQMDAQLTAWQGEIDAKLKEIDGLKEKIQKLIDLISQRG